MAKRKPRKSSAPKPGPGQFLIVFFTSPTGRAPWMPVKIDDVPSWVKDDQKVMAHLLAGNETMKCDEGIAGSNWYRAIRATDLRSAAKLEMH